MKLLKKYNMIWKILIIAAFIGMLKPLVGMLFDSLVTPLAWVFSLFVPGLILGVVLAAVMIIGEFMCICTDTHIFGFHPFWVGLVIGSGWYIIKNLVDWIRYR